jgi:hypothetical protein
VASHGTFKQGSKQRVFTHSQPLGPATLDDETTRADAAVLFDGNNEVDDVIRRSAPVFLIGRRGAGKTAFLKANTNDDGFAIDLNSPELISQVGKTIAALDVESSGQFTERIVPIWEACFIAAICSEVWSSDCPLKENDCPEAFAFGRALQNSRDGRATDVATSFLLEVRKEAEGTDYPSVRTLIDSIELNGVPLWLARETLSAAAIRIGWTVKICLDSLDQYKNIFYQYGALVTDGSLALQGLFRSASRLGRSTSSFYRVQVSFPAELWHYFSTLSANPLKDFDNSVLLHWNNYELLQICATRFLKYLAQNFPAEYRSIGKSSYGPRFAQAVFLRYLPNSIVNSVGIEEPIIPYLLRHTQLLPRHIIQILNLVFAEQNLRFGFHISRKHILQAVATAENRIVDTIINSYEIVHPGLRAACQDVVPHLRSRFETPELHKIVNRNQSHGMEYRDVLSMFVEAGVVGRYTESTDLYDKADFEYLHIHRLVLTGSDHLCLHPLFARAFGSPDSDLHTRRKGQQPILPLGSDPDSSSDYRRYIHLTRSTDD